MTCENIGQKIADIRRERHLTQADLAERTELSVKAVSNIENDNASMRIDTFVKICDALDVPPNDLLGYKSEEQVKVDQIERSLRKILSDITK